MKFVIENEEYITLDDVKKLVGMKQTSIYTRVKFKEFPQPMKLPARMLWKKSEIEKYINSRNTDCLNQTEEMTIYEN